MDHKIPPTVQAYNAIILACAKSSTKTCVNEVFHLARQMQDLHQDTRGILAFRLDKKTFCALLEGTKRIRDLGRARWILAEMVRGGKKGGDPNKVDAEIDDEVMVHVFNMYAAYTPPHLRAPTLVVANQSRQQTWVILPRLLQRSQLLLPLKGPKLIRVLCPPRVLS